MTEKTVTTIYDFDSVFNFGKHRGKTVDDVLGESPSYIIWADENVPWLGFKPGVVNSAIEMLADDDDYGCSELYNPNQ